MGGIATGLAAVIKVFSIRQDLFYVVLIGQAIGSAAQVLILPLPTKIAAVWFKPNEVSQIYQLNYCFLITLPHLLSRLFLGFHGMLDWSVWNTTRFSSGFSNSRYACKK